MNKDWETSLRRVTRKKVRKKSMLRHKEFSISPENVKRMRAWKVGKLQALNPILKNGGKQYQKKDKRLKGRSDKLVILSNKLRTRSKGHSSKKPVFRLKANKIELNLSKKASFKSKKSSNSKNKHKSIKRRKKSCMIEYRRENSTSIMNNYRAVSGNKIKNLSRSNRINVKMEWTPKGVSKLEASGRWQKWKNLKNKRGASQKVRPICELLKAGVNKPISKKPKTLVQYLNDQKLKSKIVKTCQSKKGSFRLIEKNKPSDNDTTTIFESFEKKSRSIAELFQSFSHSKVPKSPTQKSCQTNKTRDFWKNTKLSLNNPKNDFIKGVKVYGKLRKTFGVVNNSNINNSNMNSNADIVEFLDDKVFSIQKAVEDHSKVLASIRDHRDSFRSVIKNIEKKLHKMKQKFENWMDFKERQSLKRLKDISIQRDMAMLTAEIFSVTPNTIQPTKKNFMKSFFRNEEKGLFDTPQVFKKWQRLSRKLEIHVQGISTWFFEALSNLSGFSQKTLTNNNPLSFISNRDIQISNFKNVKVKKDSRSTYNSRKSQKKNFTSYLHKNLRVGTSASYNGKDFAKLFPKYKQVSTIQYPSNLYKIRQETATPKSPNLIESRLSMSILDKGYTGRSVRPPSQKIETLQESHIFRQVKFPSARFFYTGKKLNLTAEKKSPIKALGKMELEKKEQLGCVKVNDAGVSKDLLCGNTLLSREGDPSWQNKTGVINKFNQRSVFY